MPDNFKPELETFILTEEEASALSEANLLTAAFLKTQDYFSFKFRPDIAWAIVDSYIDQYEYESLKEYLIFLYMMVEYDERSGPLKRLGFFFSTEVRKSYYEYKSEAVRILEHGSKAVSKIEGRPFVIAEHYKQIKEQEFEQRRDDMMDSQTTANQAYVTTSIFGVLGSIGQMLK